MVLKFMNMRKRDLTGVHCKKVSGIREKLRTLSKQCNFGRPPQTITVAKRLLKKTVWYEERCENIESAVIDDTSNWKIDKIINTKQGIRIKYKIHNPISTMKHVPIKIPKTTKKIKKTKHYRKLLMELDLSADDVEKTVRETLFNTFTKEMLNEILECKNPEFLFGDNHFMYLKINDKALRI